MSVISVPAHGLQNGLSKSDESERYEIIDGMRVELPPMSTASSGIASHLMASLDSFGMAQNVGRAYTEMLFHLPLPIDRNRRPDVSFVPFSRWPRNRPFPPTNAWDVLPDLAVEVISPTDIAEEIREKVVEYFRAGVRLVWVFYPRQQVVDVYESPTQVRILARDDELDGGVVVPGFRLPLRELFLGDPASPGA